MSIPEVRRYAVCLAVLLFLIGCSRDSVNEPAGLQQKADVASLAKGGATGDPLVIAWMNKSNQQLAAKGLNFALERVEFFTIGQGRPDNRIHQMDVRRVPGDPRRNADGDNITYMVDPTFGATLSGLSAAQTEAAITAALTTWATDKPMKKVPLIKRPFAGIDPSIVDELVGFDIPGSGVPFQADIIDAGWYPRDFFDAIGGPGGGAGILGVTFTFVFIDGLGNPTDINNDHYEDEAFSETYFNNTFGDPASPDRAGNPWALNQPLPAVDVQTVALHENGHGLDLGHFGPPPTAVMNPVYGGIRQTPFPSDNAGLNTLYGSWPNR